MFCQDFFNTCDLLIKWHQLYRSLIIRLSSRSDFFIPLPYDYRIEGFCMIGRNVSFALILIMISAVALSGCSGPAAPVTVTPDAPTAPCWPRTTPTLEQRNATAQYHDELGQIDAQDAEHQLLRSRRYRGSRQHDRGARRLHKLPASRPTPPPISIALISRPTATSTSSSSITMST